MVRLANHILLDLIGDRYELSMEGGVTPELPAGT